MLSENLKQCKICNPWSCTGSGGYTKHICTCQHQSCLQSLSDNERLMSLNPLLSLSTNNQSPDNDYNCDLYEDQSYDESNRCYHEDYPLVDDDCSSQSSDDSLDQYYLIHNGRLEEPNCLPNNASPRSDAQNRFQVMLHDLIMRHKASLQMFDDICHPVNEYTSSQEFSIHTKLQYWKSFLRYMEGSHWTHLLWPTNCNVTLHDGKTVTVPVFDMKEMLISILTDKTLMSNTNFVEGYNVLTGDVDNNNPCNQKCGEVHTGDAGLPARDRLCANPNHPTMPVGLIVLGDKSHTNLHGTLALTPIIFTLTLFNRTSCNNTRFWNRLATSQICHMEKVGQTVEKPVISYKASIHVSHASLNFCAK
jgi:hypothetical protein